MARLGIVGGGQLGRMTAQAAQRLGVRTFVWDNTEAAPALQVSDGLVAAYDDPAALSRFLDAVDTITYEFENLPLATLHHLEAVKPVYPRPGALAIGQDRWQEKAFFDAHNLPTAPWCAIGCPEDCEASGVAALFEGAHGEGAHGAVLKTARMGYDGKGQRRIRRQDDLRAAWEELGQQPCILETFVPFEEEVSVIVARDQHGHVEHYPPVRNMHHNHILRMTIAPAPRAAEQAVVPARTATEALDVVGLLAVEFFVLSDGRVLLNEMAPRPHNSGHWSMDGCALSQFDQLAGIATGQPARPPACHTQVVMLNLLGDEVSWAQRIPDDAVAYLYGKKEARPGRKMGHINFVGKDETWAEAFLRTFV